MYSYLYIYKLYIKIKILYHYMYIMYKLYNSHNLQILTFKKIIELKYKNHSFQLNENSDNSKQFSHL